MKPIDFASLWRRVTEQFLMPESIVHGPDHWRRVERNARILVRAGGGDETVARLFALFHDSRREDDGWDPEHGARGAELAREWRGVHFNLPDATFELLHFACTWHTAKEHHDDPTIAACWDADRLDLGRIGVRPDPRRLNTKLAREIAGMESAEKRLRALAETMEFGKSQPNA